jgi:hypothetical protein
MKRRRVKEIARESHLQAYEGRVRCFRKLEAPRRYFSYLKSRTTRYFDIIMRAREDFFFVIKIFKCNVLVDVLALEIHAIS